MDPEVAQMLERMAADAEFQMRLHQAAAVVAFVLSLVSTIALVCIAVGVARASTEIAGLRQGIRRAEQRVMGIVDEMRQPPSRKGAVRSRPQSVSDEEAARWLSDNE